MMGTMNTALNSTVPADIAALASRVTLAGPSRPGVIQGTPATLSAICAYLGFRNDCRKGSVYLTPAKLARLGL
jgi:hypothetical protein